MVVKEKQVQIPESLFDDIIDLLLFRIKPGRPLNEKTIEQSNHILDVLSKKQAKMICHKAYSKMATTKNEDEYNTAKMNYQLYKNE